MSHPGEERIAKSGRPPKPPRITARGLEDHPDHSGKTVYLLDPMVVRDLASVLGLKPFQVVADLMQMEQFKQPDEEIDFETASRIARKHGYQPQKPPPGVLVL